LILKDSIFKQPRHRTSEAVSWTWCGIAGWAKARSAVPPLRDVGGHAEPVIGRAFARPVGFAHPASYDRYDCAFSPRVAPELGLDSPPNKGRGATPRGERGMPGARCTRSRACRVGSTRVSHHEFTGTPGIPARNGFNGLLRALLGDQALLSPSPAESLPPT
jgi:hypothetical protein